MNTEEEILFERGSNPSLRRANRAAKQQGNQPTNEPVNLPTPYSMSLQ